ncbi:hypothetical protein HK104_008174, partial [Borealophlyctis nickersoniae]
YRRQVSPRPRGAAGSGDGWVGRGGGGDQRVAGCQVGGWEVYGVLYVWGCGGFSRGGGQEWGGVFAWDGGL